MIYTDKEKTEFLKDLVKQYYDQGDDYYVSKSKRNLWHFGYSNDKPLQHGTGESFIIPDKMLEILISK